MPGAISAKGFSTFLDGAEVFLPLAQHAASGEDQSPPAANRARNGRAYQVYAVKAIVDCIDQNCGNGYVWHTTGSGKTLTSFKAATLLKANESIHKGLFVVDRKDLDRQTREEFNRFQENCVEENTNNSTSAKKKRWYACSKKNQQDLKAASAPRTTSASQIPLETRQPALR